MSRRGMILIVVAAAAAVVLQPQARGAANGTEFSYQGRLLSVGAPATGSYDFQFTLYNADTGGSAIGSVVAKNNVPVSEGLFTVSLDFGAAAFGSDARWLAISVRPSGGGAFTDLAPRQSVLPTPFSLSARSMFGPKNTSSVYGTGDGYLELLGPNGKRNLILSGNAANPNCGVVSVCDAAGSRSASMYVHTDGRAAIETLNTSGTVANFMTSSANGAGYAAVYGPNGSQNARMTYLNTNANNGFIAACDSSGTDRAAVYVNADNGGQADFYAADGDLTASAGTLTTGEGFWEVSGPNGSWNARAWSLNSNHNYGYLAVFDHQGTAQAAMFVDSSRLGTLAADQVSVSDAYAYAYHVLSKTKSGQTLSYAPPAGPEDAIYCRGKVALSNGRGTIVLPDHFAAQAVPDSVTVQLTPASLKSRGVAVASIALPKIEIGELFNGTGSYEVHYLVHAVRKGHENFEAVMSSEDAAKGVSIALQNQPPASVAGKGATLPAIGPVKQTGAGE